MLKMSVIGSNLASICSRKPQCSVRTVRNCTASLVEQAQHQVGEASTLTDVLLPSSVTTPTLLSPEPRVPAPSKGAIQLGSALFWTNRQKIRTPEQFSSTAKESAQVYRV